MTKLPGFLAQVGDAVFLKTAPRDAFGTVAAVITQHGEPFSVRTDSGQVFLVSAIMVGR